MLGAPAPLNGGLLHVCGVKSPTQVLGWRAMISIRNGGFHIPAGVAALPRVAGRQGGGAISRLTGGSAVGLGGQRCWRVSQSLPLPVQHEIIHRIIFILKINSPKGPGCAVPSKALPTLKC